MGRCGVAVAKLEEYVSPATEPLVLVLNVGDASKLKAAHYLIRAPSCSTIKYRYGYVGPVALRSSEIAVVASHTQLCVELVILQSCNVNHMVVTPDVERNSIRSSVGEHHPDLPLENDFSIAGGCQHEREDGEYNRECAHDVLQQ